MSERHASTRVDDVLRVEHLTMRFGGVTAVSDLSFSVKKGHITALIGPNGAGKTTVFNCITGFYKPTKGRIAFAPHGARAFGRLDQLTMSGRPWSMGGEGGLYLLERMEGHRIAGTAKVARTFQNIRLFAGMTVLENLLVAQHLALSRASLYTVGGLLGLKSYRAAERDATELAAYWLGEIGLLTRADDAAGSLAYGDQRRLEIARAMCSGPHLLCLDEPAAGLNARKSADLNELLLKIRGDHGLSLLLIEHDMGVVMGISDRIIVLDYGRKIAEGAPEDIRTNVQVIAAYLGVEDEDVSAVEAEVGL